MAGPEDSFYKVDIHVDGLGVEADFNMYGLSETFPYLKPATAVGKHLLDAEKAVLKAQMKYDGETEYDSDDFMHAVQVFSLARKRKDITVFMSESLWIAHRSMEETGTGTSGFMEAIGNACRHSTNMVESLPPSRFTDEERQSMLWDIKFLGLMFALEECFQPIEKPKPQPGQ